MSEEDFMKNINWLSNLKLRLSWGQTGNADISTNAFASYGAQGSWINSEYKTISGVMKSRLENPDLKWETTTEWNLGLDFGFLKSRITGSVELYQRVVSDLLNYKPLNSYQEVKQIMANVGKTQSRGVEITLNSRNIITNNFFGKPHWLILNMKTGGKSVLQTGNQMCMRKRKIRLEPYMPVELIISCR